MAETARKTGKKKVLNTTSSVQSSSSDMRSMISKGIKLEHFIPAMLAKETDKPFNSEEWLFEIKWDGYRAIAELNKKQVNLYSRNGLAFNEYYPAVVDELKKLNKNLVLDGELVVLNENGLPDFQMLQHYSNYRHFPLVYYVFDILFNDGEDITAWPLIDRKELLKKILPSENSIIRYSDHITGDGVAFFEVARKKQLEGIMAKKINSHYLPGKRSAEWLKIKHHQSDEAIIVGYTEPTGARKYFGALVLAIRKNNELLYAGHTGTGFDEQKLREVYELLQPLKTDHSPFNEKVKTNTPVTWVKPEIVCELKFTEKTKDGKMRHPVFLRIRDDKKAEEVNTTTTKTLRKPVKKAAASSKEHTKNVDAVMKAGRQEIVITNKDKLYFPDDGITKLQVAEYYDAVADYILPYLKNRPQSLKRNPNGIKDKGFYHKDAGDEAPDFVDTFDVESESQDKTIHYIVCNNKASLLYMANLGCIEINPWHSTTKKTDNPTYFIIDIDPSENNTTDQVVEAALAVKKVLDKAGAPGFIKTSGATGLHIYVPTANKYTYEQVKNFAQIICSLAQQMLPEFTTLERNIKKRGKNRIYMDYLQNNQGQTIASVYSLRPRKGATVSTPLEWKEVKKGLNLADYNIHTIHKRLQKKGDLFKGVLGKGIDMMKCLKKLQSPD